MPCIRLALAALLTGVPALAQSGPAAAALARASVTVQGALAAGEVEPLELDYQYLPRGGEVVVEPGATGGRDGPGWSRPAHFRVLGRSAGTLTLALPDPAQCALVAGGARIPVLAFKVRVGDAPVSAAVAGFALNDQGLQVIRLGLVLRLAPDQPGRAYRGYFPFLLSYN